MRPREVVALRDYLDPGLTDRTLSDARHSASLTDIAGQTCLKGRLAELSGRSVLLATSNQFLAALVMLEVDGIARRMLLCPPDLKDDHLQAIIIDAEIDAVVTDQPDRFAAPGIALVVIGSEELVAAPRAQTERATEWLMLTSGTLGMPKIVGHTLEGLTGAIAADAPAKGNRPDIPDAIKQTMKLHFVESMDQVLKIALEREIVALPIPPDLNVESQKPAEETVAH